MSRENKYQRSSLLYLHLNAGPMMSIWLCADLKALAQISAIFVPVGFQEVARLNSCLLLNAMQSFFFIGTRLTSAKKITIHDVMGS